MRASDVCNCIVFVIVRSALKARLGNGAVLLKNSNRQLIICSANESVRKVLETFGFTSLISLHPDENEALAAFT